MRKIYYSLLIVIAGCNTADKKNSSNENTTDTIKSLPQPAIVLDSQSLNTDTVSSNKIYANDRFREVTVVKQSPGKFIVKGKARVFEAAFSWVVEDGHNEIRSGHEMADAGGPAWGNFSFTLAVVKARPNSILNLILFEASAKDGSRQSELHIPLP
ncbi:MAG: Gmad2 immunoglobulin-like domain-containing protein [Ferruginibacter sp.]